MGGLSAEQGHALPCKSHAYRACYGAARYALTDGGDVCIAGSVKEVYTSPEPGTLRVESITRVGDKVQQGLQVYRRQ